MDGVPLKLTKSFGKSESSARHVIGNYTDNGESVQPITWGRKRKPDENQKFHHFRTIASEHRNLVWEQQSLSWKKMEPWATLDDQLNIKAVNAIRKNRSSWRMIHIISRESASKPCFVCLTEERNCGCSVVSLVLMDLPITPNLSNKKRWNSGLWCYLWEAEAFLVTLKGLMTA